MYNAMQIVRDFSGLGRHFREAAGAYAVKDHSANAEAEKLKEAIEKAYLQNPWFLPVFVKNAFLAWADAMKEDKLEKWMEAYPDFTRGSFKPARVGIIMAGNIPMVGFHDLLCVIASGNHAMIRLSSSDDVLIPAVLETLCEINPVYRERFSFVEGPMKDFDAIIATGSNNSSRYFEYYFGRYPHIIRRNRNGIAVLTGNETAEELSLLADDIFMYFGLGCRNVAKVYLPGDYAIDAIFHHIEKYAFLADNHKYRNNYDYQKSLLLINRVPHHDNGFLLVKHDPLFISPISVLNTEFYDSISDLADELNSVKDQVQCIVSVSPDLEQAVRPGRSQFPELWDYADGVDVMKFLASLRN